MKTTEERTHKRSSHTHQKTSKQKRDQHSRSKPTEESSSFDEPRGGIRFGRQKEEPAYFEAEEA